MNEILNQLLAVPPDVLYLVGLIFGACLMAVFLEDAQLLRAVRTWFLSVGGGTIVMLILTGIVDWNLRIMCGCSIACGFLGSYLLHLVYDNREVAGGYLIDYLKFRRERQKEERETSKPPNA